MAEGTRVAARRPLPRPAAAGWVALSLALSLTAFRPQGEAHDLLSWCVWAAVLAGFVGAWLLPLGDVHVTRHVPAVAVSGRRFTATYVLDYRGRRALRGVVLAQPDLSQDAPALDLLPDARPVLTLALLPLRRGELRLGEVTLEALGPLGLFARRVQVALPADPVLVRPNPRAPRPPDLAQWLRRGLPLGTWSTVRDWRPGDPRRWVHARLSARRGFPVVAPPERQPDSRVSLGPDAALGSRDFERAVSYAAGLGLSLLRRGVAVNLRYGDLDVPCRGRDGRAKLLDALARVHPGRGGATPRVVVSVRDGAPVLVSDEVAA
ncbi:MAG: DUF58 domain-containing protein [Planctomycetes bacterium]|nr:DUF58 domain-containing protein [Planctomycetota bacterium]